MEPALRRATRIRRGQRTVPVLVAGALATAAYQQFRGRREAERIIEARIQARFQAIIEEAQDFFFLLDANGVITYTSPSVEMAAIGTPPRHLDDLLDMLEGTPRDIARTVFYDTAKATGTLKVPIATAIGQRWIQLHLNDQTANPAVGGIIVTGRDITDQENLSIELARQATADELTGLPNRRALNTAGDGALARSGRSSHELAMLLIDLDGFKGVNDTLGHPAGDALLREVAHRLQQSTRAGETLARLGGDEFAVIAENLTDEDAARALAERLIEALRPPIEIDGQWLAVGTSIGFTVTSDQNRPTSSADLLKQADIALYEAKRQGRGRALSFTPAMAIEAEVEARLLREVQLGFDRGEFHLVFQPLVSTNDSETVAFESLMRWHSPTLGIVSPVTFIPIAERTGAIIEMGRWALMESCRRLAEWNDLHPDRSLSVSVNISLQQITDDDLPALVKQVLDDTGLSPHQLQLEVTESMLARNPHKVTAPLQALRDLGVRVALDDFGTGYSSMAHLQTLPVDCIKIDRAFIERLKRQGDRQAASVIQAIVDLGNALDVVVVAEGVEDQGQLDALLLQKVEMAQGFLFAHPLEPEQVGDFLDRRQLLTGSTQPSTSTSGNP